MRCSIGRAKAAVLPGARASLPEHITPLEQQRNRFALNRRRFLVAERRHGVGQLPSKTESGKGRGRRGLGHWSIMTRTENWGQAGTGNGGLGRLGLMAQGPPRTKYQAQPKD